VSDQCTDSKTVLEAAARDLQIRSYGAHPQTANSSWFEVTGGSSPAYGAAAFAAETAADVTGALVAQLHIDSTLISGRPDEVIEIRDDVNPGDTVSVTYDVSPTNSSLYASAVHVVGPDDGQEEIAASIASQLSDGFFTAVRVVGESVRIYLSALIGSPYRSSSTGVESVGTVTGAQSLSYRVWGATRGDSTFRVLKDGSAYGGANVLDVLDVAGLQSIYVQIIQTDADPVVWRVIPCF